MGDYEGALGRLSDAGLDQLTEKSLPTRSLRIVAESYAIKGEKIYSSIFVFNNSLFKIKNVALLSSLMMQNLSSIHFVHCFAYST